MRGWEGWGRIALAGEFLQQQPKHPGCAPPQADVGHGRGERGRFRVDLDHLGAGFLRDPGDVAGGGNLGGGADHHEDAAGPGLLLGLFLGKPRDRLAEQDHVGLEDLAAVA